LLDGARAVVREQVVPLEAEFLSKGFGAVERTLMAVRADVRARKLWSPQLPIEHGGLGLPLGTIARLSAVLGETPLGHFAFNCQAPDVGNMELLASHGTPSQQKQWLAPLARGDVRSCFAMTEPEFAGSNPVRMDTRAVREGDEYLLSGHKWFTSSADGAAFAIVMAVTAPDEAPHRRASMFLVPMAARGVEFVRNIPVMGEAGEGWASHAELRFTECRVPASDRIGDEGAGFALAQERLGPGRIHHCMRWIGICERAISLMSARARSRELAPGDPIASRQSFRHRLAECRAEVDAATLLVLDTAERIERDGAKATRMRVSLIKFHVARVLQRVLDDAIQVHGAFGLTDETPLGYWYRHERAARIYDGADEVHKDVVAREMLGDRSRTESGHS
jgi:alkylation response protein AidB-like acyl-CoA dehydrogenase